MTVIHVRAPLENELAGSLTLRVTNFTRVHIALCTKRTHNRENHLRATHGFR
jgi:hypothetical protein